MFSSASAAVCSLATTKAWYGSAPPRKAGQRSIAQRPPACHAWPSTARCQSPPPHTLLWRHVPELALAASASSRLITADRVRVRCLHGQALTRADTQVRSYISQIERLVGGHLR